ncbi:WYL domain-containing protein [Niabella pedocola]|uniref:WYL domain-containing protein n=1 Tax=Niabella pedocola TaxID=1752077 RepID=A0ABS8PKU0_9BACT|nr:WYL domain-containing protein [Niabella pedocola]MCD2421719.1 WYL domain-containing protein [Niabella pedocola]
MAINKLALIRYKIIDDCLRNRMRKWTLEELIHTVSEKLYEQEGVENGVSKRTIQGDIQIMRSDKLGYNAPIEIAERKYYYYTDEGYSITKAPMNEVDMNRLKEVIELLKQFNAFQYLEDMGELVARLEDRLYSSAGQTVSYIQFEANALLKGLHFITPLYQSIRNKKALVITYQSFKALQPATAVYYPYLLKEYRNRWFLICRSKKASHLLNLALDRIIALSDVPGEPFVEHTGVDWDRYYNDLVGVTKNQNDRAHKVIIQVNKANAPYVLTKPLHHSQQLLEENDEGIIIRIDVILNFELERELLSFGETIKVLAPRLLAGRVARRLLQAARLYGGI